MTWGFERGRIYNRRRDIHDRFGGQRQGGIITPSGNDRPVIVITGDEGLQHGYADRFAADGTFEYFGEGQRGDMVLARRNAVVAEHVQRGRDLLLFRTMPTGLRFEGPMICTGYHWEDAPDHDGRIRRALVFELHSLEAIEEATEEVPPPAQGDLAALRRRAFAAANHRPNRRETTVAVVERSRAVRDYVSARALGHCEGCGAEAPFVRPNGAGYLEPHHIRKLGDGGPDDPRYVIALCPTCHRRVHFGRDGRDYNDRLLARMRDIERV